MLGVLEGALVVGGALLTLAVGGPVAAYLARPASWGSAREWDREPMRNMKHSGPGFAPLDLGPDNMRWPSEIIRKDVALDELPWPSETWDDPHFGKGRAHTASTSDADYERRLADRRDELAHSRQQQDAQRRATPRPAQNVTPQPLPLEPRRRATPPSTPNRARRTLVPPQAAEVFGEIAARSVEAGTGAKVPSPAELERLVAQVGLAATVQEIMSRTGWDFRKAAHHLARARQGLGR